jgi:hypothetical protein
MSEESYKSISVILPVYRQSDHVAAVIEDYVHAVKKLPIPVNFLLVPNGGEKATEIACTELEKQYETVRSLPISSGGWGRAVREGLAAAEDDLVCYTNSSRTNSADLVLLLLYGIANPGLVIKANRKIRDGIVRRFGSLFYNLECRALYDLPMWDVNGTPKLFPRSLTPLLELERDDDLIDLEFNVICRRENYRMLEVPILSTERHGGKSTTNWSSAAKLYTGAWRLKNSLGLVGENG